MLLLKFSFLLLFCIVISSAKKVNHVEENLKDMLDFLKGIISGLLPLKFDGESLSIDTKLIQVHIELHDVVINGLDDFVCDPVTYEENTKNLILGVTFNAIPINFEYVGNISLFNFVDLFGEGPIKINFEEIYILFDIKMNVIENDYQVENLSLQLKVQKSHFEIHGLKNDEQLSEEISKVLSANVPELLTENSKLVNDLISPILKKFLNTQDLNDIFQ